MADDARYAVPLRDYLEARIESETGKILTRLNAMDDALEVRTDELERHLTDLNHAHEKAVEDRQSFVTKDTFIPFQEHVLGALNERKGGDRVIAVVVGVAAALLVGGLLHILGVK